MYATYTATGGEMRDNEGHTKLEKLQNSFSWMGE